MFQACARLCIAVAAVITSFGQTSTNLTGQWDFNQGDLKATVGTDMKFLGDTATKTTFDTVNVNGANGNVMTFPAVNPTEGYLVFHGAKPNGGGTNVNVYTLVLDLFWPSTSDATFRALYNTDTNNLLDAVMFVNPDNAIGVNNDYSGEMLPETWYRLALVVSLNETNSTFIKYLNGSSAGSQTLEANSIDSRFSLGPALLLFTDAIEDTTHPGLVDRVQIYSEALSGTQVAALGLPLGDGGPPVGGDVKIDSIQLVDKNVVITASGGGTLQLVRKDKLTDTTWQPVGQPSTSGTFTTPASGATGFFRVQRLLSFLHSDLRADQVENIVRLRHSHPKQCADVADCRRADRHKDSADSFE
jgi:hypothetical protein